MRRTAARTEPVPCVVPRLRGEWVAFRRSAAPVRLDAEQVAALDAAWEGYGLRGAVVLHPLAVLSARGGPSAQVCEDEVLTANVLYRARSGLLHAAFGLTDLYLDVTDVGWCTDDPRLVRLANDRRPR